MSNLTRRAMKALTAGLWIAALSAVIAAASPASAQETVAITNAEIHTVSGGVIQGGTLVLRDGRIAAVGATVSVPAGARTIDGTGKIVTPGLIDSHTQIGLIEIGGQAPGTQDGNSDLGLVFNPRLGVNPRNTLIPINRIRGITAAVVRPGGGDLFSGQGALIALDGETVDAMTRAEATGVYTELGEENDGSRAGTYLKLHNALMDARDGVLGGDDDGESDDPVAKGERSDLGAAALDVLERVIRGELPLVVEADRVSDIRLALRLADEFDVRLVLVGAREGWEIAGEIAAAGAAVVVNPLVNLPEFPALTATYANAGRLQAAGVEVLLSSFSAHQVRDLLHGAGQAVSYGMDHAAALRAVTLGPAMAWGVADAMGSLEEGKVADVVVWSGDPFELSTSAEHVFIGGREIPDDSRQERLFERYRTLPVGR